MGVSRVNRARERYKGRKEGGYMRTWMGVDGLKVRENAGKASDAPKDATEQSIATPVSIRHEDNFA